MVISENVFEDVYGEYQLSKDKDLKDDFNIVYCGVLLELFDGELVKRLPQGDYIGEHYLYSSISSLINRPNSSYNVMVNSFIFHNLNEHLKTTNNVETTIILENLQMLASIAVNNGYTVPVELSEYVEDRESSWHKEVSVLTEQLKDLVQEVITNHSMVIGYNKNIVRIVRKDIEKPLNDYEIVQTGNLIKVLKNIIKNLKKDSKSLPLNEIVAQTIQQDNKLNVKEILKLEYKGNQPLNKGNTLNVVGCLEQMVDNGVIKTPKQVIKKYQDLILNAQRLNLMVKNVNDFTGNNKREYAIRDNRIKGKLNHSGGNFVTVLNKTQSGNDLVLTTVQNGQFKTFNLFYRSLTLGNNVIIYFTPYSIIIKHHKGNSLMNIEVNTIYMSTPTKSTSEKLDEFYAYLNSIHPNKVDNKQIISFALILYDRRYI